MYICKPAGDSYPGKGEREGASELTPALAYVELYNFLNILFLTIVES